MEDFLVYAHQNPLWRAEKMPVLNFNEYYLWPFLLSFIFLLVWKHKIKSKEAPYVFKSRKAKSINKVEEKCEAMGCVASGYEKNPSSSHPRRALCCKCWDVRSKLISLLKGWGAGEKLSTLQIRLGYFPSKKSRTPERIKHKKIKVN